MEIIKIVLNFFELVAFLVGLYFFKNLKYEYQRLFVWLLGFIFCSEMLGKYFKYMNEIALNNFWYGCIVIPLTFIGYFWLFAKHTNTKKMFILSTTILLMSVLIENIYLKKNEYTFQSLSYSVGNILLLITIFRYIFSLLNSKDIIHVKRVPFFWMSLGLLLFYLPTFPFYFFINYLYKNNFNYYLPYWYFTMVLNCMMYVCFSISFLWKKIN